MKNVFSFFLKHSLTVLIVVATLHPTVAVIATRKNPTPVLLIAIDMLDDPIKNSESNVKKNFSSIFFICRFFSKFLIFSS